jgi:hypothetical protein
MHLHKLLVSVVALGGVSPSVLVQAAQVQKSGLVLPSSAASNQAAVKKIFTDTYSAYRYHVSLCSSWIGPNANVSGTENSLSDMMTSPPSLRASSTGLAAGELLWSTPWTLW